MAKNIKRDIGDMSWFGQPKRISSSRMKCFYSELNLQKRATFSKENVSPLKLVLESFVKSKRKRNLLAQKNYFDFIGEKLHINVLSDWYSITTKDILKHGGGKILKQFFDFSLIKALKALYPEHEWLPWKFTKVPRSFWGKMQNRIQFFDWMGKQMGFTCLEDWYQVTIKDFKDHGGIGMIQNYYQGSMVTSLKSIYPEHSWKSWKFQKMPKKTDHEDEVKGFIDVISKKLQITNLEQWYRISLSQIGRVVPMTILHLNGGLGEILSKLYPQHNWDFERLQVADKASQRMLRLRLEEVFPSKDGSVILEDYQQPKTVFDSGNNIQLDIFLPDLSLGFEYQGQQHFFDIFKFSPQKTYAHRDQQKRIECDKAGISLIEIPYWWDSEKESLLATIYKRRPDLFEKEPQGVPIPFEITKLP